MTKPFIIAEIGVNHNGKFELARRMVEEAAAAGADAVKFQAFWHWPDLRQYELTREQHVTLKEYAEKQNMEWLCTPFSLPAIDFIESLKCARVKVSSGFVTCEDFLDYLSGRFPSVVLSTGMADMDEVARAVEILRPETLTLMHCVTEYPIKSYSDCNLLAMDTMRHKFCVPVGYSDHSGIIEIPIAAAAMGAEIIEAHFTLSRQIPGPDQEASLEPQEFAEMVEGIKAAAAARGDGRKVPTAGELTRRDAIRRRMEDGIHG